MLTGLSLSAQVVVTNSAGKFVVIAGKVLVVEVPWTPKDIPTTAWFDASASETITVSAGAVSGWADQSTNNYDLVQLSGSKQPQTGTRTLNGLNVLDCDGISFMSHEAFDISTDGNIAVHCVLAHEIINSGRDAIWGMGNSGFTKNFYVQAQVSGNFNHQFFQSGLGVGTPTPANTPHNGPSVYSTILNSTSGTMTVEVDGKNSVTNGTYIGITDNVNFRVFRQGSFPNLNPQGYMAEYVVVSDVSDETTDKIEGYLAWKWGLEDNLPVSHLYKYRRPLK